MGKNVLIMLRKNRYLYQTYRYKVCEYLQQEIKEKTLHDNNVTDVHSILQENLMYS